MTTNRLLLIVALVLLVIATIGAFGLVAMNYAGFALLGFVFWVLSLLV